jgi:PAS domain S-box-containing protein
MPERMLHILLVEDNPDHADLFLANLAMTVYAGARIVRHETLDGALTSLGEESFDLVFIDLSLKDSTVTQTLGRLKELGKSCPAVVLTSLDDKRTILEIISRGAADCLPKSELNDVLLERVIHFNLDRWRLRQELVRSKEAYRDLYHGSPNMLASADAKTRRVLNCNQTLADRLGWSREEIAGQEADVFHHPDCQGHFSRMFAEFLTTGTITNAEVQLVRKDGGRIDALLNASAVRDSSGTILHARLTWIDITGKKAAERQLQHIQRLNRLIIDTIPDLLWLKDIDGHYLLCNPPVAHFFGATETEIIGKTDHDLTDKAQADRFRAHDLEVIAARRIIAKEEWGTDKDGASTLVAVTKALLVDEDGRTEGVMGIGHDITELREAVRKAEDASRAKSVFLSNMSHELRTPLNAILGYTQIFLGDDGLTSRQRKGISTIHQAGEHLLLLINDILDISRIESGKLELLENEFSLIPFLHGIKDIIQLRAAEKGLDFRTEFTELPPMIVADELRLRQVLLNLLSNAVKFTSIGGCVLRVAAEAAGTGRAVLTMVVEDSGCGITPAEQQVVFEPFIQVGERLQHREGTGLGLAISRELARLMGGELKLISPLRQQPEDGGGPGSRFFFSINVAVPKGGTVFCRLPPRRVTGYAAEFGQQIKVLAVDDNPSNRAVLRDTLEPLGFKVREAADGSEVLPVSVHFQPDLVLMDLRMPKMDGFTAAAQLRQQSQFAKTPIIAVTASIAEGEAFRRRCAEHGFNGCIRKPFAAAELLELIASQLRLRLLYSVPKLTVAAELVLPPQEILAELANLADLGQIQGIADKAAAIALLENGRYQTFARRVQELTDEFNFTALQNLIKGQPDR